jgi:hypothetical protein
MEKIEAEHSLTRSQRSNKCTKSHERGNQLLDAWRDVVSHGSSRVNIPEYLSGIIRISILLVIDFMKKMCILSRNQPLLA